MNIDIVNKELSNKLGIKESKIALVNKFYWDKVKKHISSYSDQPINISKVCVIYPDKYLLKKRIFRMIKIIRCIKKSKRFTENSDKQIEYIENSKVILRKYLKIRKDCKFTN